MDIILSQLPPWFIIGAIILIAGFVAFLVTRSLKEGREISFWPPRIGPKVTEEPESKNETVKRPIAPIGLKQNIQGQHLIGLGLAVGTPVASREIPQVNVASEPIGIIRVTSGPSYGLSIFLTRQTRKISFGRSSQDDTSVAIADSLMSGQHFVIRVNPVDDSTPDGAHFQIQLFDLASTNGTFVNNKRVQMADLKDGDVIRAGGSSFQLYLLESGAV